ncbi:lipid asymmetry maintenance ABC transporter permease subunit MlaE [Thioalkalivibrio sp. ALMg11]|uniref:lipid asymmetry maintenance ABC transporter permease subunit MlaE n=1 Tax=Thioalkalivibrio sp. ALMg11 TaxID=1158165 RepID=UPI00036B3D8B|nr:lipid asymmetry maintenance ABC transporter permease subunit MlaE [Thioalkalivibrio sp. ALMg11]
MTDAIASLGRTTINALTVFGRAFIFLIRMLASLDIVFRRFGLTLVQVYSVGVRSLLIIIVSGLFVGMVLAYQGYITLVNFGAAEALGSVVALSLVRELGPVVTALLFAGRAGSALTAELGLMKTTEQLSAMEMMAVNPYRRIFAPRFVAGFLSMPLLAAIFSAVGVMGGYLVGVGLLGVDSGAYFSQMQSMTDWNEDVLSGVIKSIVFGFVVTWIAVFQGFNAQPTSEGISRATTQTVVVSSLAVLGLDFILTGLMFGAG